MIVTVVGAGACAQRKAATLLGEGHYVRLIEDGSEDEMTGAPEGLPLDEHAATILDRAVSRSERLQREHVSVEARRFDEGPPSLQHPRCEVLRGRRVVSFGADSNRRVTHLLLERPSASETEELRVECLVLATDALTTARIFLQSWQRATGERAKLTGLLRAQHARFRFVTPEMIGRPIDAHAAGPPRIALLLHESRAEDEVRGFLATAEVRRFVPDVASLPADVRTSFRLVRDARAALGSVELTFPDRPRATCSVELAPDGVAVHWAPPTGDRARQARALARARRALRLLDVWALPGVIAQDAAGIGDYAGVLPRTDEERPFTTRADGRSRDFEALFIDDPHSTENR